MLLLWVLVLHVLFRVGFDAYREGFAMMAWRGRFMLAIIAADGRVVVSIVRRRQWSVDCFNGPLPLNNGDVVLPTTSS